MAGFIPVANTARMVLRQSLHNQNIRNVIHVEQGAPWSSADLEALCDLVMSWWIDDLAPHVSVNLILDGTTATDLSVPDSAAFEKASPPLSVGGLPTQANPGNVAWVCKFLTGFAGRAKRGRYYLAGLTETQASGNQISEADRDTLVAAFGSLRNDLTAAGKELVIASLYDGFTLVPQPDGSIKKVPTPRAAGITTPVLSFGGDVYLDSQRRRLAGRGS